MVSPVNNIIQMSNMHDHKGVWFDETLFERSYLNIIVLRSEVNHKFPWNVECLFVLPDAIASLFGTVLSLF